MASFLVKRLLPLVLAVVVLAKQPEDVRLSKKIHRRLWWAPEARPEEPPFAPGMCRFDLVQTKTTTEGEMDIEITLFDNAGTKIGHLVKTKASGTQFVDSKLDGPFGMEIDPGTGHTRFEYHPWQRWGIDKVDGVPSCIVGPWEGCGEQGDSPTPPLYVSSVFVPVLEKGNVFSFGYLGINTNHPLCSQFATHNRLPIQM